jgi:GH15 family glucan-1,4-alpha-glucosidase
VERLTGVAAGKTPAVKRKDGYAPIGAYAAIGDGRTTALVAADGAIDFLSLPALDSPTTFGALLDPEKGGRFVLQPAGRFHVERRYVERTNVLETTYRTKDGAVRVTDSLNLQGGGLLPWRELARRVEGLSGAVDMHWEVQPRFEWGATQPALTRRRGTPVAEGAGLELAVHVWDAGESALSDGAISGSFSAREGARSLVVLSATHDQPIPIPKRHDVERRLDETVDVWRRWLDSWDYDGAWDDHVARSALALKLLVLEPNGAVVAAPTTSLPERIGGDKNYDYRYMWVRDTGFTIDALLRLGLPEQVHESFCCLLRAVEQTAPDLRPFYSVDGHEARRRDELPLRGYRDSRPVRYGNAASSQLQLGSWGDLLETTDLYVETGNALDQDTAEMLVGCVDRLSTLWTDEDSGIWELDDHRHYTAAKIAVWMGFDRALKLVELGQLPGTHAQRWREERERVRGFVEERCWSEELGAYVEFPGADGLDAAVLRGARMGWAQVAPDRFTRTIDAVRERLDAGGGLLYRTERERGEEGAFVACSFWTVEALARTGRAEQAAELFEELLGYENDVGLLSEQIDPDSHELLGNFPQGLSHLSLISAAGAIQDARDVDASATADAGRR